MTVGELLEMLRPYDDNVQIRISDFEINGFVIKRDTKGNPIVLTLYTKNF